VERALGDYDRLEAPKRLAAAYQAVTEAECPSHLRSEFDQLCRFRNECFHADPVLITRTGRDETTKRGRIRRRVRSGEAPEYPLLWDGSFPLTLSHAMRAVALHDEIVGDLFVRQDRIYGDPLSDDDRVRALIHTGLPDKTKAQLSRVSE